MRNMEQQAGTGQTIVRRRPVLDITAGELVQINQIMTRRGPLEAIITAYLAGLSVGIENARPNDPENLADFSLPSEEEEGRRNE